LFKILSDEANSVCEKWPNVRSIEEGIFIKNYLNLMTFFKVFDSDPIGIVAFRG